MTTPAPARRRWWRPRLYGVILGIVVVYASVITLYALSGQVRITQDAAPTVDDTVVEIETRAVHALDRQLEVSVTVRPSGPLAQESPLAFDEDVVLLMIPVRGEGQVTIPKDQIVAPTVANIALDGSIDVWPFDRYEADSVVILPGHVVDDEFEALQTYYTVDGEVPGWAVTVQVVQEAELPFIQITAQRSIATIVFAMVLLALMIVTPVLVLMVAISAYRGHRKVEATLMSWMGAMLFATIPLRNFFPGAPPIGSWVDYLVVLWVIVGLVTGLAIFAAAWMRWTPRPDAPPRF
ncbi:DUF4436 family protein [Microbacterium sp. NPDC089189]|uniref:DUF4436 family protein n=1 Tax=Microbacterium sp. NPDC089189 TaxID=3154972 RepID=UPI00342B6465